jgi:dehydrogenase/reductase SDR family member 7B
MLINNAGISFRDTFENASIATAQRLFNVNFFSNIQITKAFLPLLKKGTNGQIVVTSSMSGYVSNPCRTLYVSSKAAVNSFYNSLRTEVEELIR